MTPPNTFEPVRVAIVGATGPTGRSLAQELVERGTAVRAVSRSLDKLEQCFGGTPVETVSADALDANQLREAVAGCDVVVDAIGLPPDKMAHHETTARSVVAAAESSGARCLLISSFWGYLPFQRDTLDESHPRAGGPPFAAARRTSENIMLEAGAAVAHLPDFFGPHVHTSTLQRPLQEASGGNPMTWMGSAVTEREYAFVPDAMRIVAELIRHPKAYGESWIMPGSGQVNANRIADIATAHLGRRVKVRAVPARLLKFLSLFMSDLRAFRPMIDDYVKPISYDARKLTQLLGPRETTSYESAIPLTLDHISAG